MIRSAGMTDEGSNIWAARRMNLTVRDLAQLRVGDGEWMGRAIAIAASSSCWDRVVITNTSWIVLPLRAISL